MPKRKSELRWTHSLESGVVELVLVSAGGRGLHPLICPQTAEGLSQKGQELLILPNAPITSQHRLRMVLRGTQHQHCKEMAP